MTSERDRQEQLIVSQAMIRFGGSFVGQLGKALLHADPDNARKIRETWPELWEKYLNWKEDDDVPTYT